MYGSFVLPRPTIPTERLLEDWMWLLKQPHDLLFVTKMGDAFLRTQTESVTFLDTLEGDAKAIAPDERSFNLRWDAGDLDPTLFNPDLIALLESRGMNLGPDECYSYELPPVMGGALDSSNVHVVSLLVHFSIGGQLHRQVKDLPPGARISRFEMED
jgi:hypothetical protein